MRNRLWITALIVGITCLPSIQTAQVRLIHNSHLETVLNRPDVTMVIRTSHEIKKKRPQIPSRVLAFDSEVIDQVQPAVQTEFKKRGFDDHDAFAASLVAWKEVRLNSPLQPTKPMNRVSFVEFVTTSIGKVVFTSTPDEARVTVGIDQIGPTEVTRWYANGTLNVLFEKDGFESVKRTCEVKAPGFNECKAELKPKHE